jgi:hypothetical protein
MPGLAKSNSIDSRGARRLPPRASGHSIAGASGLASTDLMPAACELAIPRLDGIPIEQQLWEGERAAARLAHSFLAADVADAADWFASNRNPFAFLKLSLERWFAMHGAPVIREQFSLDLLLSTSLDRYFTGERKLDQISRAFMAVEPDSAGYVVLAPTLKLLEAVHPRLPATFLYLFLGALNRWVRVFDYRDALDWVERLRDWYESDPAAGDIDPPDVQGCVPKCANRHPLGRRTLATIMRDIKNLTARRVMRLVLEMNDVSDRHVRPELDDATRELLMDCGEPVPALLAVFEQHDRIEGCFDEECQTMLEVTPAPNVIIPFNGETKDGVLNAFDILATVCETLSLASRLITIMPGNEPPTDAGANP